MRERENDKFISCSFVRCTRSVGLYDLETLFTSSSSQELPKPRQSTRPRICSRRGSSGGIYLKKRERWVFCVLHSSCTKPKKRFLQSEAGAFVVDIERLEEYLKSKKME
ncbi:unnamed protein product [Arabis nemorensis]|uniref:Uncharacterized protein n=1 Tax=Arabis nemorensis TaxID=586526 RepID=A0A565B8V6_9BRAS|nr:unnamed protein product [Arabis nemorensis]